MRAILAVSAAIIAIAIPFVACKDPIACPDVSPDDAGAAFAPQPAGGGSSGPPLSCAYFDHCGEIVCTSDEKGGWKCARNEDWNNCDDAGPP